MDNDHDRTVAGTVIGGTTGFLLLGAALLPVALPAVIAAGIATLGMIGGAFTGGTIAAEMSDDGNGSAQGNGD